VTTNALTHTPYALADLADCASPDTPTSPGAEFLLGIQSAVNDADVADLAEGDHHDLAHEIADSAPDVYTHARWREFVDLCAYQEEPEFGDWPDDLTEAAGIALYQIAYRLAERLLRERIEIENTTDDDQEPTR